MATWQNIQGPDIIPGGEYNFNLHVGLHTAAVEWDEPHTKRRHQIQLEHSGLCLNARQPTDQPFEMLSERTPIWLMITRMQSASQLPRLILMSDAPPLQRATGSDHCAIVFRAGATPTSDGRIVAIVPTDAGMQVWRYV